MLSTMYVNAYRYDQQDIAEAFAVYQDGYRVYRVYPPLHKLLKALLGRDYEITAYRRFADAVTAHKAGNAGFIIPGGHVAYHVAEGAPGQLAFALERSIRLKRHFTALTAPDAQTFRRDLAPVQADVAGLTAVPV